MFNKRCICWLKKGNFDVIKLHVTTIKIKNFLTDFCENPNIKFHEIP